MKRLFFIISIFFIASIIPLSCEDALENVDAGICNVDNPLEDLPWLKDIVYSIQLSMRPAGSQIIQYTYKGDYVFWVDMCYQCADGLIEVYNCAGEVICEFGGVDGWNTCPDFETEATDSTNLFQSFESL